MADKIQMNKIDACILMLCMLLQNKNFYSTSSLSTGFSFLKTTTTKTPNLNCITNSFGNSEQFPYVGLSFRTSDTKMRGVCGVSSIFFWILVKGNLEKRWDPFHRTSADMFLHCASSALSESLSTLCQIYHLSFPLI